MSEAYVNYDPKDGVYRIRYRGSEVVATNADALAAYLAEWMRLATDARDEVQKLQAALEEQKMATALAVNESAHWKAIAKTEGDRLLGLLRKVHQYVPNLVYERPRLWREIDAELTAAKENQ